MKTIKHILIALSIIAIVALTSCGKDNPAPVDPQQEMIEALAKTWTPTSITLDGVDQMGNWPGFNIQLTTTKGYTTNSSTDEQKLVWPLSGSYTFPDATNANKVLRDDGVEILLSNVTATSATLSFTITGRNGRTDGLIGEWVFAIGN